MTSGGLTDIERGPQLEGGEFMFDQDRLERDYQLTQAIQAGYAPPTATPDNLNPRIVDGDLDEAAIASLRELWEAYVPAAQKAANRYANFVHEVPAIDGDDLLHEGFFALMHSALRWSPDKRITFLTHFNSMLSTYMNGYILRHSRNVRAPRHIRDELNKLRRSEWNIYQKEETMPSRERLAGVLGKKVWEIDFLRETQAVADQMGSLEGGYFEDDRDLPSIYGQREAAVWHSIVPQASEQPAVADEALVSEMGEAVQEMLDDPEALTYKQREMIRMRFLDDQPHTLEEAGEKLGVNRERARQVELKALTRLRHPHRSKKLRGFAIDDDR